MEESDKLPLKRVELSLSKFNEVAIPHHLDLLRQHRANIIKYEECGEYGRVRAEQTHARRVAGQLRALLSELQALRARVRPADRAALDERTSRATDRTLAALADCLDVLENSCRASVASSGPRRIETSPLSGGRGRAGGGGASERAACGSAVSSESIGVLPLEEDDDLIQLQVNQQEPSLAERAAAAAGRAALLEDVRALHAAWRHLHDAAHIHAEHVSAVATHAEAAADNVHAARAHLSLAERLRGGWVCAGGACVGALAGGPAGLALGAKAGAAAALLGSLLGYLGGRSLSLSPAPAVPPAREPDEDD